MEETGKVLEEIEQHLSVVVEGAGPAGGAGVLGATRELDALLAAHRGSLDPRLVHFLGGRSYGKALVWVRGGRDVPAGRCSGN